MEWFSLSFLENDTPLFAVDTYDVLLILLDTIPEVILTNFSDTANLRRT